MDVNYRTQLFGRLGIAINQAFYFTNLKHPLIPTAGAADGALRYESADGTVRTRALETNAKFTLSDVKLFLGDVYLNAQTDERGQEAPLPLTPEPGRRWAGSSSTAVSSTRCSRGAGRVRQPSLRHREARAASDDHLTSSILRVWMALPVLSR